MADAPLDPNFYRVTYYPGSPLNVTGYVFSLSAKSFDFTNVPGFDLSRVRFIQHVKTGLAFYKRDLRPFDLAAVDGVAVPGPPTTGKVLIVKPDMSQVSALDEFLVAYYPAPAG